MFGDYWERKNLKKIFMLPNNTGKKSKREKREDKLKKKKIEEILVPQAIIQGVLENT